MTQVEHLADFIANAGLKDMSAFAVLALKIRVLDAVGCALGALSSELIRTLKEQVDDFGGRDHCTLVGGGKTAPDRAAFFNCALVRYLDFNDSYLAKGETCREPRGDSDFRINSDSEPREGTARRPERRIGAIYE